MSSILTAHVLSAAPMGSMTASPAPSSSNSLHLNLSKLLDAIAQVETGNRDHLIGPSGERSRYQISRLVWRQWNGSAPFHKCTGPAARACAYDHLLWLHTHLPSPDIYSLAYSWRGGLTAYRHKAINGAYHDYATRVVNLYMSSSVSEPHQ